VPAATGLVRLRSAEADSNVNSSVGDVQSKQQDINMLLNVQEMDEGYLGNTR